MFCASCLHPTLFTAYRVVVCASACLSSLKGGSWLTCEGPLSVRLVKSLFASQSTRAMKQTFRMHGNGICAKLRIYTILDTLRYFEKSLRYCEILWVCECVCASRVIVALIRCGTSAPRLRTSLSSWIWSSISSRLRERPWFDFSRFQMVSDGFRTCWTARNHDSAGVSLCRRFRVLLLWSAHALLQCSIQATCDQGVLPVTPSHWGLSLTLAAAEGQLKKSNWWRLK